METLIGEAKKLNGNHLMGIDFKKEDKMKHHEGKITERKLEEEFRRSREKMNKAIHSERREEELFRHKRR